MVSTNIKTDTCSEERLLEVTNMIIAGLKQQNSEYFPDNVNPYTTLFSQYGPQRQKTYLWTCVQRMFRSASAFAQSDQNLP